LIANINKAKTARNQIYKMKKIENQDANH